MEIDPNVATIALDRVEGFDFERFVNDIFPRLVGKAYTPLGGYKDGGADAYDADPIHERVGDATVFYQASIEADVPGKIRRTVARLKKFKRDVKSLTYITSRPVSHVDKVETDLTEELDVSVRIWASQYIIPRINESSATQACYERHLRHLTDYLQHVGSARILSTSQYVTDPTVFIYLRQEADKRSGDVELIESLTDTLTLWALEGTDPDQNILMDQKAILAKIDQVIPAAAPMISEGINKRLRYLSSNAFPGGKRIRYHARENAYVLPYEARKLIELENAADESLAIRVRQGFVARALNHQEVQLSAGDSELLGAIAMRVLQIAFEKQGLLFSSFLSKSIDQAEYPALGDAVRAAIEESNITGRKSVRFAEICIKVARDCVYGSSEDEREYLRRLSRTYTLLFTLRNEPKVISFFEQMASEFYLYVGSDILIRALSERFLPEADQVCRNTMILSARTGMSLILTEPVLEEVLWNLRTTDLEYVNRYAAIEESLTDDMIREVPKIMLRTYLYNRHRVGAKSNWPAFVEQFCSYRTLHKAAARGDLKTYLLNTFGMSYNSRHDLDLLTDSGEVVDIAASLRGQKKVDQLAQNDALLACSVYGHRGMVNEGNQGSEFGYQTWWLTSESSILRHTSSLVRKNDDVPYMMRPEFLLNFLALAPSASKVRESFGSLFPSMLGIQLSRQMNETTFNNILVKWTEAQAMEPGRRAAVMASLSTEMMSDFSRSYLIKLPVTEPSASVPPD